MTARQLPTDESPLFLSMKEGMGFYRVRYRFSLLEQLLDQGLDRLAAYRTVRPCQ